jgi:hypothetical protein
MYFKCIVYRNKLGSNLGQGNKSIFSNITKRRFSATKVLFIDEEDEQSKPSSSSHEENIKSHQRVLVSHHNTKKYFESQVEYYNGIIDDVVAYWEKDHVATRTDVELKNKVSQYAAAYGKNVIEGVERELDRVHEEIAESEINMNSEMQKIKEERSLLDKERESKDTESKYTESKDNNTSQNPHDSSSENKKSSIIEDYADVNSEMPDYFGTGDD